MAKKASGEVGSPDGQPQNQNRPIAIFSPGGEDSDLYETMGYVRKSARKSGLTRKQAVVADAKK